MPEILSKTIHSFSSEDPVSTFAALVITDFLLTSFNSRFFLLEICSKLKLQKNGNAQKPARRVALLC